MTNNDQNEQCDPVNKTLIHEQDKYEVHWKTKQENFLMVIIFYGTYWFLFFLQK